jgi:hypothetical protein
MRSPSFIRVLKAAGRPERVAVMYSSTENVFT